MVNPLLPKVLIVDDKPHHVVTMQKGIESKYNFIYASSVDKGLEKAYQESPDVVLMDYKFPRGKDGLEGLQELKLHHPGMIVIFISNYFDGELIAEAQHLNADECISKEIDANLLSVYIDRAIQRNLVFREHTALREEYESNLIEPVFVSKQMMQVKSELNRLKDTRATILLTGAPGTGKTVIATWIHYNSIFNKNVCRKAYIPELTDESFDIELFGRYLTERKHPFEAAGLFEIARGGTVILDEIGELTPLQQAKLVKVFQDGLFKQVDGYKNIAHDVRIIAATNKDLRGMVKKGDFRADLYASLNTHTVKIPRLVERKEDIPGLAAQIVNRYRKTHRTSIKEIDSAVCADLKSRAWPDNVRGLENLLGQAIVKCERDKLTLEHIRKAAGPESPGGSVELQGERINLRYKDALHCFVKEYLSYKLKQADGNVRTAADLAGMNERNFRRKMNDHGVTRDSNVS